MKKIQRKWMLPLLLMACIFLSACSVSDNGVTPFGQVSFPGNEEWSLPMDDTSSIAVNGVLYYRAASLAEGAEVGECIAAANGQDHYSYRVYKPQNETLDGIIIVNAFSRYNLTDIYSLYASTEADDIPAELVDDFPHKDDWWNGGQIVEMNGTKYCSYGSTAPHAIEPGEKLFTFDGKSYYAFLDEPQWILRTNEADESRFDLYYEVDRVTELPIGVFKTTIERIYG